MVHNRRQPKPPKSSWSKKASRFLKWNSDKLPWFQKQKAIEDQNGVIEETVRRIFTPHLIKQLKHRHPLWTKVTFKWQQTLKRLLPIGGASEGNRITIYDTGDEAYKAMWSAIEQAKERVWLETYILDPDHIGKRFINGLVKAARSGCEVKLIYDYVGSSKLHTIHLKPLIEAGAEVVAFNPLITWPWKVKHWGFFRNHRKILVIDDKVAFTGGMNIGEQYASKNIGGNGYFRDTHVRIIGPAVHDLADVFLNSLKETRAYEITGGNGNGIDMEIDTDDDTKDIIPLTRYKQQKLNNKNNNKIKDGNKEDHVFVQILQSNVRRNKLHIQKAMRLTLNCASNNCYMSTPYFLPPQSLKKSLINAGKRGIDVRILTAGVSDVPMVRMASQHVYSVLLRNGIRIYEYFGATLHAKTATIDGIYSSIGSFNLDIWSHLYNLEINMSTLDHKTASQLEDQFMRDLQQSTEVTLADLESRSFIKRAMYWSAYHLLRIFDFKPFYSTVGIQKAIPVRTQTTDEHKSIEG